MVCWLMVGGERKTPRTAGMGGWFSLVEIGKETKKRISPVLEMTHIWSGDAKIWKAPLSLLCGPILSYLCKGLSLLAPLSYHVHPTSDLP